MELKAQADLFNITYPLGADCDRYNADRLRRLADLGIRTVAIRFCGDTPQTAALVERSKAAGLAIGVVTAVHGPGADFVAVVLDALRAAKRLGASRVRVETSMLDGLETPADVRKALLQLREVDSELKVRDDRGIPVGLEPNAYGSMTAEAARDLFHELDSERLGVSINPSKLGSLAVGAQSSVSPGENLRYNLRRFLACYYFSGYRRKNGRATPCNLWNAEIDFISIVFRLHFSRDVPPDHVIVEDEAVERLLDGDERDRFHIENMLSALSEYTRGHPGLKAGDRNLAHVAERTAWGRAELIPDGAFAVAAHATYAIRLTIGPGGVECGGELRLQQPHLSKGGRMQVSFPDKAGYVSVKVVCQAEANDVGRKSAPPIPRLHLFTRPYPLAELVIGVAEGSLQEGDTLTVVMGDTAGGSPGIIANKDLVDLAFTIAVRPSADADLMVMTDAPVLRISSGPAARLAVVAPSIVAPGESIPLTVRADDSVGYPCRASGDFAYAGTVELTGERLGISGGRVSVSLAEADAGVKRVDSAVHVQRGEGRSERATVGEPAAAEDVARKSVPPNIDARGSSFRIVAVDRETGLSGRSNPICCREAPERRLYWGDIHSHSTESDGRLPIDFLYRYARDYAALDFASSGDHGLAVNPDKWDIAREYAARYNAPHRFVTLLGTEFSKPAPYGDRNAYFKTLDVPPCTSHEMEDIWDWVAEHGGLLIPHQLASPPMAIDWQYHDPRVERLVEIASCHGNFEKPGMPYGVASRHGIRKRLLAEGSFYQDALARGYRLGVVGSSDAHDTHTGHTPYGSWRSSPLAAVWAKELTRESIFQAMWERRCYATSGARIVLETWVNGAPMGSEIEGAASDNAPVRVRVSVVGTAPISAIDIIRNNRDVHTARPESEEAVIDFVDELEDVAEGAMALYYYVRVTQTDGEMAWSSPVWITTS